MLDLPMKDLNTYRVEQLSTHYMFVIPVGTPLSAVMSSEYWVHVRNRMKLYDLVEAIAADGTYEAKFRIVALNKITGTIKFRLLSEWHDAEPEAILPAAATKFKARWVVGNRTWAIDEIATGKCVIEGLSSKADAEAEALRLDQERKAA